MYLYWSKRDAGRMKLQPRQKAYDAAGIELPRDQDGTVEGLPGATLYLIYSGEYEHDEKYNTLGYISQRLDGLWHASLHANIRARLNITEALQPLENRDEAEALVMKHAREAFGALFAE